MAKKEAGFVKNNLNFFINSFKRIKLVIFLILLLDFAFYFIFIQLGNLFIKILTEKANSINLEQSLGSLNQQAAVSILGSLRGFFIFLIFSIMLFLIIMIVNCSLFKGIIWNLSANKRFSLKFFKKFLLLNLIWIPLWFLAILLLDVIIKPEIAIIYILILGIIAFYFTEILYPLFLKDNKIKNIKEAFRLGIKKMHYFVFPYAIIIFILFVFLKMHNLVGAKIDLNPTFYLVPILVLAAWLRYYFLEIVDKISQ